MSTPQTYTDEQFAAVFRDTKTIAVVGVSDKPERASNEVFLFLQAHGYDCVGVNPALAGKTVHGAPVFADLAAIDRPIDLVDVFRASDAVLGIVDEVLALAKRPHTIWMQLGVVSDEAAEKARAAGVTVIMDRCPKIEIKRMHPHKGAQS